MLHHPIVHLRIVSRFFSLLRPMDRHQVLFIIEFSMGLYMVCYPVSWFGFAWVFTFLQIDGYIPSSPLLSSRNPLPQDTCLRHNKQEVIYPSIQIIHKLTKNYVQLPFFQCILFSFCTFTHCTVYICYILPSMLFYCILFPWSQSNNP